MKTLTIGFTGTIASGKTARCHHLVRCASQMGRTSPAPPLGSEALQSLLAACQEPAAPSEGAVAVKYINADLVGHAIYAVGTPCHAALVKHFGTGILVASSGAIDRRALGKIVFGDAAQLQALNALCWPHIQTEMADRGRRMREAAAAARKAALLLVIESALLIETDATVAACTDVWVTHCAKGEAVRRVQQRDGLPEAEALRRVESQQDLPAKLRRLRELGYAGRVETFDTTSVTLAEGLGAVEKTFAAYWAREIEPVI